MTKRKIVDTVLFKRIYALPERLPEFLTLINEAAAKIPGDLLHKGRVEIDVTDFGGSGSLSISYTREETDEEEAARCAKVEKLAASIEQQERAKLAELIAKYGIPSDTENRG